MILTDEKIAVTDRMMERAGLTRYNQFGVPVDINDNSKGIIWKKLIELDESDLDKIEEYFLIKERECN